MDRFIAPNGLPTNAGTKEAPWSLGEVLGDSVRRFAQPGDTVYLLPGTYRHPLRTYHQGFRLTCVGEPTAPITFRSVDARARTTIDGGLYAIAADNSSALIPKHVRIQELEFLCGENLNDPRDVGPGGGSDSYQLLKRPAGGITIQDGHDVRITNCVIHHASGGIGFWGRVGGESELYGNLIFDNGWRAADRLHGNGVYAQHQAEGWKHLRENVIFDNWSTENVQVYGSSAAYTDRVRFERNIGFITPQAVRTYSRFLLGGANPSRGVRVNGNLCRNCSIQLGYSAAGDDAELRDNVSWFTGVSRTNGWTNLVEHNNLSWQVGWAKPRLDGVEVPVPPSQVWLLPNAYDALRATLVIHNYQNAKSIDVQVAGFAEVGDGLSLYDPRDFYGAPKHNFEITAPTINVPLDGPHACFVAMVDQDPCRAAKQEAENLRRQLASEQAARAAAVARIAELENSAATNASIFERVNTERAALANDINQIRLIVNQ